MAEADFRSVGVRECGERAVVVKGRASSAERGLLFGRFGTAIVSADGGIGISDLVFRKMMLHLFETNRIQKNKRMKKYRCTVCEWIYDPAVGDPDGGIAAGTAFEDIPEDWVCPLCGVGKDQFEPVEE